MVSVVCSYDDLSRKLWNLKGLPLTVTAVQGVHPALRYTDVSVPRHGLHMRVCREPRGERRQRQLVTLSFCGSWEPLG